MVGSFGNDALLFAKRGWLMIVTILHTCTRKLRWQQVW
jgi:hypothetical protein